MELQKIPKTVKIIIDARLLGGLNDTICNVCYSGPITAQVSVQCIMNDRGRIDCDHKLLLQGSWVWVTYQQSYEEAKQKFFFNGRNVNICKRIRGGKKRGDEKNI